MKPTRAAAVVLVLGLLLASQAFAQATTYGYGFGAPGMAIGGGQSIPTIQGGGGVEARFPTGFALSADLAFVAPVELLAWGFGILSPNVTFYAQPGRRFTPFVTGGYSLAFREGVAHGWNLGGGFEYSRVSGITLRVEVRDQIIDWGQTIHLLGVRVGATFRPKRR